MVRSYFHLIVFAFLVVCSLGSQSFGQLWNDEEHVLVSMRMIGHEILLLDGDSTSRVLPVEKIGNRYKISFESEFAFRPNELVATTNRVISETFISQKYRVEVQRCNTIHIVHSFEVGIAPSEDVIPCGKRDQPRDCYSIWVTLLDGRLASAGITMNEPGKMSGLPAKGGFSGKLGYLWLMLPLLLVVGIVGFIWKKRQKPPIDPHIIQIGAFLFDTRNTELIYQNQKMELTSKEADLLLLLHSRANANLEREVILKTVWGDEGNYVGRTLDVFISKLRKKLQADESLKIVNIRGVGYKLVVND